jgi:hypothetical protein
MVKNEHPIRDLIAEQPVAVDGASVTQVYRNREDLKKIKEDVNARHVKKENIKKEVDDKHLPST